MFHARVPAKTPCSGTGTPYRGGTFVGKPLRAPRMAGTEKLPDSGGAVREKGLLIPKFGKLYGSARQQRSGAK